MPAIRDETGDRMSLKESCFIADRIKADPSLLDIPLHTIERWTLLGHGDKRTLQLWKLLIERAQTSALGFRVLQLVLRSDSKTPRNLKGFSPFAGLLSGSEASRFACVSRHG